MRTCVELCRSNVLDPLASHDGQSSCTRFSDRRDIPTRKPVQGSAGRSLEEVRAPGKWLRRMYMRFRGTERDSCCFAVIFDAVIVFSGLGDGVSECDDFW